MSSLMYTYPELLDVYRRLLIDQPGTALDTGSGIAALLDNSGDVYGGLIHSRTGKVDHARTFDFDQRSFRDGRWEDQSLEETLATVDSPTFIDLAEV